LISVDSFCVEDDTVGGGDATDDTDDDCLILA
jgi:hypothetical protein